MPLMFYPHPDDTQKGSLNERLDVIMEAAERFKAVILDSAKKDVPEDQNKKRMTPRDQVAAYNWEEIARILREIRELPEANKPEKDKKAELLTNLAEVYEVLRGAKMSKLEAVRLALISEANQLRGSSQVA
jgi:DNA segregation ATPase FtsK/SpoIIIE-like protein